MGHELNDLAGHHRWATANLLAFCRNLDDTTLNTKIPGTYGSIWETLRHIFDSEASYLFRMTDAWPELPWKGDDPVDFDILTERAALLATVFEEYVASDFDTEKTGVARGDDGTIFAVPVGVFVTQILHHANEHRAHVCTALGVLGFDPPSVSAWEYSFATGRSTVTSTPSNS